MDGDVVTGEPALEAGSRIRILPPELAEQIAAGEVVERPASVVKELVENALDAGARKIEVVLEAGGRRLCRVVDDGCGMTPGEARLALKRHATSKLRTADDLWRLDTFGFRGEALPSIAAVSRLVLATKPAGTLAGFRLALEGGREQEARETGMPDGTQIEVRELFFNTPARLKFLKTEATEAANVSEALLRLALAHPGVHVKLRSNDRAVLDLPPVADLGERVRTALGRRGAGALHEAAGEENGVVVRAFLGPPEEASSTPRNSFLFVGRRAVRDRSLLSALVMGYGELLEKGRYPLAALLIDVPGAELDVNVHPQKLEVRFARAQEVYAAVRHVVGAAIARAPWLVGPARSYSLPAASWSGAAERAEGETPATAGWSLDAAAARAAAGGLALGRGYVHGAGIVLPAPDAEPAAGRGPFVFGALRYVGQVHRTYLVCEAPGELVLVDQHAAHERVAYARLRASHRARAVARQQLLFAVEVELDEAALASLAGPPVAAALAELGFAWLQAGAGGVSLTAVPELLKDADPRALFVDALRAADEPSPTRAEEAVDHLLATMACHSVTRAGDVLQRAEALALLASLDEVDMRAHCPHGRPVLVRMTVSELERRFGRA